MRHRPYVLATVLAASLLAACGSVGLGSPIRLEAQLQPIGNTAVAGTVQFYEIDGGVLVEASVTGLTRRGHAFHIHENGDCANPGGHFNPDGAPHARWNAERHHAGDLPMLVADRSGLTKLSAAVYGPSARPGKYSIIGRTVVVHERRDDLYSQPDGDAGPPLACGVIRRP